MHSRQVEALCLACYRNMITILYEFTSISCYCRWVVIRKWPCNILFSHNYIYNLLLFSISTATVCSKHTLHTKYACYVPKFPTIHSITSYAYYRPINVELLFNSYAFYFIFVHRYVVLVIVKKECFSVTDVTEGEKYNLCHFHDIPIMI